MSLQTIKTAVFDNDGVNINSETLAMRICDDWLSEMVATFTPNSPLPKDHIYSNFAGKSTNKIASLILEEKSLPLKAIQETYGFSDEKLAKIKTDEKLAPDDDIGALGFALADLITLATNDGFEKGLQGIYGITQAHEGVRALVGAENVYLATTSRADRMDVSLEAAIDPATGKNAGLADTFPEGKHRLSGYGKPNKYNLFFQLAEERGEPVDPATTIVIEDSLSGVRYAKDGRPDLRVIGTAAADFFPDKAKHAKALTEAGASVVVTDIRDLPATMEWLDTGLLPEKRPTSFHGVVYSPADFKEENELDARLQTASAPKPPEVA